MLCYMMWAKLNWVRILDRYQAELDCPRYQVDGNEQICQAKLDEPALPSREAVKEP